MYQESDDGELRCRLCGDSGLVIVPHPRCVWQGRLTCYPGSKRVYTCAVACSNRVPDRDGYPRTCPPGERAAQPAGDHPGLLTWDRYTDRIGGLDGVAMLADYEAGNAERARDGRPPGWGLAEMYPELMARAGLTVGVGA